VGAALLALALGPCAGVALAAPATSGFIVATATSGALAEQAPQAGAAQTTAINRRRAAVRSAGDGTTVGCRMAP